MPGKGQDFGNVAKEFSKSYLKDKTIIVQQKDIDRYGRVVAIAIGEGGEQSLNEALLKAGLAWHYSHYDHNPKWAILAETAKHEGKGLWKQTDAIAPWEFRKTRRSVYQ